MRKPTIGEKHFSLFPISQPFTQVGFRAYNNTTVTKNQASAIGILRCAWERRRGGKDSPVVGFGPIVRTTVARVVFIDQAYCQPTWSKYLVL